MDEILSKTIMVMGRVHAKDISIYDEDFLMKSLKRRQAATKEKNIASYCRYLEESSSEAAEFFNSLHIVFSRFFRDPLTFALLEQRIIPGIISSKPDGAEIRVWSAGCALGQEAYSIAMLLDELISTGKKALRYRIFATDISGSALASAENGVFDPYNIQNLKVRQLQKYFITQDKDYTVVPQLKRNISFSYYDLLNLSSANPPESIFGDFDLVFCCNLLLYYKPEQRLLIINKLKKSMSGQGFLIVGETERTIAENTGNMKPYSSPSAAFQNSR